MKKKFVVLLCMIMYTGTVLTGCGSNEKPSGTEMAAIATEGAGTQNKEEQQAKAEIPDGEYTAEFKTDSSMFHVSEACDGKGKLTVKDGVMTIHISLTSKNIVNLFPGLAEDAQKEGADLLMPTEDTVVYSDGMTEEVNGFDVPVPVLDQEFDLALLGKKGTWYDHKVSVSNPQPYEQQDTEADGLADEKGTSEGKTGKNDTASSAELPEDGSYSVDLIFEGGSGKAKIESPATVRISDGKAVATVTWSSPNYDYMMVDGQKYETVNTEGNSVFEIPVAAFDEPFTVIGDTIAMSKPHEIEYTLNFQSNTLKPVSE